MSDYNKDAVNEAIAASNRSGRRIGGKEAARIHGLLNGWRGDLPRPTPKIETARE